MTKLTEADRERITSKRTRPLATPSEIKGDSLREISGALNLILADVFALYLKTKNFHWHLSGPHFRDYHLLFDEHAAQLLAMTDALAERVRKLGGRTLTSIGHVARLQRVHDNDAPYVEPSDMLAELCEDNRALTSRLCDAHSLCDGYRDYGSTTLIDAWIDEGERRTWFLFETDRKADSSGR
jgi:starvation-inducible DNA-binding protein